MNEQVSYTALKAHKNGVRLWIEGAKLSTAGFERGLHYNREVTDKGLSALRKWFGLDLKEAV